MQRQRSKELFDKAQTLIPGGVNSPVRAFRAVGGDPPFIKRAEGPYMIDADGNKFVDFVGSWGPLILGHAPEAVVEAICNTAKNGTSFGATTSLEIEMAARVVEAVPSVERVRFVNSGTEATMSAIRLARGFTGRERILKFAGCYHGHADAFLSEDAGSGVATLGIPGSAGVPKGAAGDTLSVPYNDLDAVESAFKNYGDTIACVILEPIACNMGYVPPVDGFLQGLRKLCDDYGAVLIFDEVITGFRVALGGAQELFGVMPDLSTFGKIIGGGLPVGAYGGRKDIMEKISPLGPVYQAGTLSGNPLAMAAGIATLNALSQAKFYEKLAKKTAGFVEKVATSLEKLGQPAAINHTGSVFGLWFKPGVTEPPRNYSESKQANADFYGKFFRALLQRGIYLAPSAFEVGFVSAAHDDEHLQLAADQIHEALQEASA